MLGLWDKAAAVPCYSLEGKTPLTSAAMGYFIRRVATDAPPHLRDLEIEIQRVQERFSIRINSTNDRLGDVFVGTQLVGQVEVLVRGERDFEDEIEELLELAVHGVGDLDTVAATLSSAVSIISVQVLFGELDTDTTLDLLGPLLSYLNDNYSGVMQADGEGFYVGRELVLEVE